MRRGEDWPVAAESRGSASWAAVQAPAGVIGSRERPKSWGRKADAAGPPGGETNPNASRSQGSDKSQCENS